MKGTKVAVDLAITLNDIHVDAIFVGKLGDAHGALIPSHDVAVVFKELGECRPLDGVI